MRTTAGLLAVALALAGSGRLAWPQPKLPVVSPPREPGLHVRIETTLGAFTVRLFEKEAPATVANFVALAEGKKAFRDPRTGKLVRRPFYDGIEFHRVVPGFMIQAGDPTGTGAYDPGFTIPDEIDPALRFDRPGRVAMANTGEKNSGNCQFFITEAPAPHLNRLHTIFGQVVEGQAVISKIARVPHDAQNRPRQPVVIRRVIFFKEK